MRVFVFFRSVSLSPRCLSLSPYLSLFLAILPALLRATAHAKYTNMFVYTEDGWKRIANNDDGSESARCPIGLYLNSRARARARSRVCTRLARPDVRDVTQRDDVTSPLSSSLYRSRFSLAPAFFLAIVTRAIGDGVAAGLGPRLTSRANRNETGVDDRGPVMVDTDSTTRAARRTATLGYRGRDYVRAIVVLEPSPSRACDPMFVAIQNAPRRRDGRRERTPSPARGSRTRKTIRG